MSSSAILGIIILFGAVGLAILALHYRNEKEYKQAMEEYERKMAAYNGAATIAAVEQGVAAAPDAAAPAYSGVGEGEVKLTGVSEDTAAMIIAVLCEELKQDPSALIFHSITAV